MKKYCFDTSGLSTPMETIPEDIHVSIWRQVREFLSAGQVAVTPEIYGEMEHIPGELGACLRNAKRMLVLEVGESIWNWSGYLECSTMMIKAHERFISEYNGGVKRTVGYNDISIIALAKTLRVPLVSMETPVLVGQNTSPNKRKIPDICAHEGVPHYSFTEFLRKEGIRS